MATQFSAIDNNQTRIAYGGARVGTWVRPEGYEAGGPSYHYATMDEIRSSIPALSEQLGSMEISTFRRELMRCEHRAAGELRNYAAAAQKLGATHINWG